MTTRTSNSEPRTALFRPEQLLIAIEEFNDPVEFERLCCDALSFLGYEGIDPQGVGRKDGGKDALLRHSVFGKVVFHFSLRADCRRKIEEDLDRVKQLGIVCDHFVFFTNRRVGAADKDMLKELCKLKLNCDLEIYDQERLRVLLIRERHLLSLYFPAFSYTTDVIQSLLQTIHDLATTLQEPRREEFATAPSMIKGSMDAALLLIETGQPEKALARVLEIRDSYRTFKRSVTNALWHVGNAFYWQGHFEQAEDAYAAALSVDGTHVGVTFNMAVLLEHNSNGTRYGAGFRADEAIALYSRAIELTSDVELKTSGYDNRGAVYLHTGRRELAVTDFAMAQQVCPGHPSSRLHLLAVSGDVAEQESGFRELLASSLSDEAAICLADLLGRHARYAEALRIIRRIKNRNRWPQLHLIRATLAINSGKPLRALLFAERALQYDFSNAKAHYVLGRALRARGLFSACSAAFRTAAELDDRWVAPLSSLAEVLAEIDAVKHSEEILSLLDTVLKIEPRTRNAHNRRGNAYLSLGMIASARREYVAEIDLFPDNAVPHFNLGVLAENGERGRYGPGCDLKQAVSHYEEALQMDSGYFPALFNLGTDLGLLSQNEEAIVVFERALVVDPNSDVVLSNLGCAYNACGRHEEATTCWKKALEINPQNVYASANVRSHVTS